MNFKPSILFNNVFDPISRKEEIVMEYYNVLADIDYYDSVETRLIFDETVRNEFVKHAHEQSWSLTYWTTSNMNSKGLNLSDLDEEKRKEAVLYLKELMDLAIISNAEFVGFCSGKVQDEKLYESQQVAFEKSLLEVLAYAKENNLVMLLEPLDVYADKKFVVGSTDYVLELCERVESASLMDYFTVCIDSAHIVLNDEDVKEAIEKLHPYSQRIHLANVVLDKDSPLFGDKHLPMGEPGFLTLEYAKEVIEYAKQFKFQNEPVYVSVEVRSNSDDDLHKLEAELREFLQKVLA